MKKQLFKMMLLGVFALASCQKDELSSNKGELVTFNLTPEDSGTATRSSNGSSTRSDAGSGVTRYVMEVYHGDDLTVSPIHHIEQDNGTFNLPLNAFTQYVCLFWADDASVDDNETGTFNASSLTNVSLNNDKDMTQAFFTRVDLNNSSIVEHNITLRRAVAKVNIVSTVALSLDKIIKTSFNGYTSFNTSSGGVTGEVVALSKIITPSDTIGEVGSLFAFASASGITSDFSFAYSNIQNSIIDVPLRANYITNINGDFSSPNYDFNVDLDQEWSGEINVSTPTSNVHIPDAVFKAYLIENFDIDGDGEISSAEALEVDRLNYSGYYLPDSQKIRSLEGIKSFVNLTYLSCVYNSLTSLDVSNNTALTTLDCSSNSLTSLDVSGATALTWLECDSNSLTSLDVSQNTALETLYCDDNSLTSLDVSNNTALETLYCYDNSLTSLDVSNNTALERLQCDSNSLTSLDVSGATALTLLSCAFNPLTSLDVSGATALTELWCYDNSLTSLDVSNNTALETLWCYDNSLTSLDVSGATALTELSCATNSLTSLDVSNNTALTSLGCSSNSLTSLDVSNNTILTNLSCVYNSLTSLDVSGATALTLLECYGNSLTSLDVSNNTALTWLFCYDNSLTSLDVSNNTKIERLDCDPMSTLTTLTMKTGHTPKWKFDVPSHTTIVRVD